MTSSSPPSRPEQAGVADLHVHTTYSDSTLSPAEVVALAETLGLTHIAITDHDSVDGLPEAIAAARGGSVEIVPGVEISTRMSNIEIHILGLFVEMGRGTLGDFLRARCDERRIRIHEMAAKLQALGLELSAEQVFAVAGKGAPGRMHVAEALARAGRVSNLYEAFHRYIADDGPAYVPRTIVTPAEAVERVRSAGGVPVLAHPGLSNCDELIPGLVKCGVMGIEAYYPAHGSAEEKRYVEIAAKHGLLVSGGSDCHGTYKAEIMLGTTRVGLDVVHRLRGAAELVRAKDAGLSGAG